jgi:hypothetical protein
MAVVSMLSLMLPLLVPFKQQELWVRALRIWHQHARTG